MKAVFATIALVAVAIVTSGCGSGGSDKPSSKEPQCADSTQSDIVATAQFNNLTSLAAALMKTGLVEDLKGKGPFTVFAPTDEAFAAINSTIANLSIAEFKAVLMNHVVPACAFSSTLENGQQLSTLDIAASKLTVNVSSAGVNITSGVCFDNPLTGADVVASVIQADVACSNGVVHVIDAVLVPGMKPSSKEQCADSTLSDIVATAQLNNFTSLAAALMKTGLVEDLKGKGPFTVFAPTDEAFDAINSTIANLSIAELKAVLLNHVVPACAFSSTLENGQQLSTLDTAASKLTVNVSSAVVNITSGDVVASVIEVDVACSNGVVHVIDAVLVPAEMPIAPAKKMFLAW